MTESLKIAEQTETPLTKRAAVKAHNASTHALGLRSVAPHEKAAYREHHEALHASLEPHGAFEALLCERIALTLWRLGRVAAYEAVQVATEVEAWRNIALLGGRNPSPYSALKAQHPDPDPAKTLLFEWTPADLLDTEGASWELKRTLEHATALSTYGESSEHFDDATEQHEVGEYLLSVFGHGSGQSEEAQSLEAVSPEHWWCISSELQKAGGLSDKKVLQLIGVTLEHGEDPFDALCEVQWTPEQFMAVLTYLKKRPGVSKALWSRGRDMHSNGARALEVSARVVVLKERSSAVLPGDASLERIQRYEAHLERILKTALTQLEVWQARRRGEVTPLARVEISGLE